ncbi:MAG TPA: 5-deoxy-glucuronate isomerase [Chloroflexota bacterium]|nr:5-deoxy-glucuronate isomerase [Chloroflexota bacterium]
MSDRSLLVRHQNIAQGLTISLSPHDAGWDHIGFDLLRSAAGASWEGRTGEREVGLVPVAGTARVVSSVGEWPAVGGRSSPFDGLPHCLYLPANTSYRIEAQSALEMAICSAPATASHPPLLVTPDQVQVHTRGEGQCQRQIRDILMEDTPAADSLLLTEVYSPAGNWSSYPPHKHDEDRMPAESPLEETYYFKIKPAQGFALQRVYTSDGTLDQTVAPRDGDLVLVPRGYHTVGAPHAYEVWYLNVLAGPRRTLRVAFDPEHVWIKDSWERAW